MSVSGFGGILDMTYNEAEPLEIVVIEVRVTVSNTLAQERLRMSAIILHLMMLRILPGTSHQRPGECKGWRECLV